MNRLIPCFMPRLVLAAVCAVSMAGCPSSTPEEEGCETGQILCGTECRAPNACGGCAILDVEPGGSCGPCALDEYACDGEEAVTCDGETYANACGGCQELDEQPGDACGPCGLDMYACEGEEAVACDGQTHGNACDGCGELDEDPDEPCGPCGLDVYTCDGAEAVTCSGQTYANACGGCDVMDVELGDPCGPCGLDQYVCDEDDGDVLVCSGATPCVWRLVSAGDEHTCGLRDDGSAWCWGLGQAGRRGDGTAEDERVSPARVLASGEAPGGAAWSDWADLDAGGQHTCGIRADDTLWCWGRSNQGQVGHGAAVSTWTPAQVLAAGEDAGGAVWSDWAQVAAGWLHTCGLRKDGTLWCWGSGSKGQRGDDSDVVQQTTPVQVLAAGEAAGGETWDDWVAVTAGTLHSCGLRDNGTVWCWGYGGQGRLGNGAYLDEWTPVQVLAEGEPEGGSAWSDWTAVSAGDRHTCGLREDGSLWCWGVNPGGRLGVGQSGDTFWTATPMRVVAEGASSGGEAWDDWVSVEAGGSHTCGLRGVELGTLWCWGEGDFGQRGDGSTEGSRSTPAAVLAASEDEVSVWNDWIGVVTGETHTCGHRWDDTIWCWGNGADGRRGDGTTDPERTTPVQVLGW